MLYNKINYPTNIKKSVFICLEFKIIVYLHITNLL